MITAVLSQVDYHKNVLIFFRFCVCHVILLKFGSLPDYLTNSDDYQISQLGSPADYHFGVILTFDVEKSSWQ